MRSIPPDRISFVPLPFRVSVPERFFAFLNVLIIGYPLMVVLDERLTLRMASGLAFLAFFATRRFRLDFSHFSSPLIHLSFCDFSLLKSCSKSLKTDYRVAGYGILATHQKEVLSVLARTVNRRYRDFRSRSVFVVKDL